GPPLVQSPDFAEVAAGDTRIKGWKVGGAGVDYVSAALWESADGKMFSIDLDGAQGAGSIEQAVATTPDITYVVTFAMAGAPDGPRRVKTMHVSANGGNTAAYSFDTSHQRFSKMGWVDEVYVFTATSDTTVLKFESMTDTGWGPVIDNVRIEPARG